MSATHGLASAPPIPQQLYISPRGSDAAAGTRAHPLASLEGARDTLRRMRRAAGAAQFKGATVWLLPGEYHLQRTFALEQQDSGEVGAPVIYRSAPGAPVLISGGVEINNWKPLSGGAYLPQLPPGAAGHVLQAQIPPQYLSQIGALSPHGFGRSVKTGSELFFAARPMRLAHWPNVGWTYTSSTQAPQGNQFGYADPHISTWRGDAGIWLRGYWKWGWADASQEAIAIDPANSLVISKPPAPDFGYGQERPFYAYNLLSELDRPGEYFIDRVQGTVLFYPPHEPKANQATISLLEGPLISMLNASSIQLEGLTLSYGRGPGVTITGGSSDVVTRCHMQNLGGAGVRVLGGFGHVVQNSELAWLGEEGITLSGGDRKTLTAAGHLARDNNIHHYARQTRTYRPAIDLRGVGNAAIHNLIHDAPHQAVGISGNDHLIEDNEIYSVVMETQDAGAIYIGRDWTERGNVIRHNYLHDLGAGDVNAVYLDDQASGTLVQDNYFIRLPRAVFIGGGRDNQVTGNFFLDVQTGVHVDARGLNWAKKEFGDTLLRRYAEVNASQPPYSTRYPLVANLLQDDPQFPKGNSITGNFYTAANWLELVDRLQPDQVGARQNVFIECPQNSPSRKVSQCNFTNRGAAGTAPTIDLTQIGPRNQAFTADPHRPGLLNIRLLATQSPQQLAPSNPPSVKSATLLLWNVGETQTAGSVAIWTYPRDGVKLSTDRVNFRLMPNQTQSEELGISCAPGLSSVLVGYQQEAAGIIPPPLRIACPAK